MLSHFKDHVMGRFGGALKSTSIAIASTDGKSLIHSAYNIDNAEELWTWN